ncbi:SDR family oxidoreductase [bacterium]|nr:SDR family oxidoreductase [bacterium]
MKTVIITGANRGLGLEFTHQYATCGWSVIATCRDPQSADELQQLSTSHSVRILPLDVSDENSRESLRQALENHPVDLLLNNAGIYPKSSLEEINTEGWMHAFAVNTIAPIALSRELLPNLKAAEQPKIAFITSLMGSISDNGSGGSYAYRSSKAALNMAARSLSIDLKNEGIHTVLLHPGWVQTDMGGPNARTTPTESINGMQKVIENLSATTSGNFYRFDGEPIGW